MAQLVDTAKRAEELGFGYLFRSDHILPTDDRRGIDSPECWTSLGVIAAATRRIRFGPMVTPVGFRNPALLAKMACTVHSFSGGRLQLAIGAGWYEAEYRAHGYEFPDFKTRVGEFKEAVEIISAMIRSGRVDYDGEHYSAHTDCLPRPSGRMHLIIGGRTKPVVRLAGRFADEWNFFRMAKDEITQLRPVLDGASDGRKVELTEMGPYLIAKNKEKLEEYARLQGAKLGEDPGPTDILARLRARDAPCGTVEEFLVKVAEKEDSGVKRIYFQTLVPENVEMIELLADSLRSGV